MLRTIPLLALGLLSSCISAQDDVIELDVEHSVEIEFFSTEAGISEEAVIIFDDLPSNTDFQTNQDVFVCAGLDLHASHITVTDLATQTDEVYVDLTIEIAGVGIDDWSTLGSFVGTPLKGSTIPFSDTRFALDATGVQSLTDILNSEVPVYRIRATGKTSEDASALSIEVSLKSTLSNSALSCPQGITAPSGDTAVTVSHGVTVDFDDMEDGQAEEATIDLGDLRSESSFAAIHADLTCAAIDRTRSTLQVMNLDGSDTNFKLAVQFRQQGTELWIPLATYQGEVSPGMLNDFNGSSFALPTEGANTLAVQAASDTPSFELRFEATSSSPITDLEIDIIVGLRFGTDATGCSDEL